MKAKTRSKKGLMNVGYTWLQVTGYRLAVGSKVAGGCKFDIPNLIYRMLDTSQSHKS